MSACPEFAAFDPREPFTRSEAVAAGLTDNDLRSRHYQRIFRGVHIASTVRVRDEHRCRAALKLAGPRAHLSHTSAARLFELPVPRSSGEHITVPTAAERRRTRGLTCHVSPHDALVIEHRGMRVSSPTRIFCELATLLDLVELVIVGDHLLKHGLSGRQELEAVVTHSRLPGASRAALALSHVRDGVDSPLETQFRMLLVLGGLPEPDIGIEVRDERGVLIRKHDMGYPDVKGIIEVNGRFHVDNRVNWESDIRRQEESGNEGWHTMTLVSRDLRDPAQTLRRVLRFLHRLGMRGLPARPGDDWRPYFR
ncbi:hypothetical protein [Nocardioides alcanivorans]|uniref:hypothetical protein n=1 Tax=Nocardioides alcanivorans TaxID=2897352 RepID=UPI001F3BD895|nr:hypothetical protein [Nocardioides alcanivorans]